MLFRIHSLSISTYYPRTTSSFLRPSQILSQWHARNIGSNRGMFTLHTSHFIAKRTPLQHQWYSVPTATENLHWATKWEQNLELESNTFSNANIPSGFVGALSYGAAVIVKNFTWTENGVKLSCQHISKECAQKWKNTINTMNNVYTPSRCQVVLNIIK